MVFRKNIFVHSQLAFRCELKSLINCREAHETVHLDKHIHCIHKLIVFAHDKIQLCKAQLKLSYISLKKMFKCISWDIFFFIAVRIATYTQKAKFIVQTR